MRFLSTLPVDSKEQRQFVEHLFQPAGGRQIDFNEHQEAKLIYDAVKQVDQAGGGK